MKIWKVFVLTTVMGIIEVIFTAFLLHRDLLLFLSEVLNISPDIAASYMSIIRDLLAFLLIIPVGLYCRRYTKKQCIRCALLLNGYLFSIFVIYFIIGNYWLGIFSSIYVYSILQLPIMIFTSAPFYSIYLLLRPAPSVADYGILLLMTLATPFVLVLFGRKEKAEASSKNE